mmetsp:Transcript_82034/g.171702  ORF Transcript_82034/g.171702 Transcript_82034/m.171702 type:complete len:402 (-) Transcript_82034:325-1530(-)|eukprot:CAMPEP_0206447540 /NCGR_PEP_ID=MMETSP0324_2-20121206/16876_1 /ASSEMBLY_ACC=CAM_ASM_000836 /TAXON_ID=2866 /ORGANISM="Crypthecodinium cohnii, Strain Seligo" /LENGTH=401 /DNA_ID=CAMNT_0053916389 /DNA_START=44 /DNA_END=1249 /DNA_ORIENTATION=+
MAAAIPPEPVFFSRQFLEQHIQDILRFYEGRVRDPSGGYHQSFYIDGTQFNPGFQQIVSSARMVINFMLAGKLFERQDLLELGLHGLRYLEEVHWVPEKEGYAFTLKDHKVDDMTQQSYGYAFVLAAHAAARLAGAVDSDEPLAKVFDLMEKRFWLEDHGAYADTVSADGVLDDYRGQNSNMHITEALIAAYEATKDEKYLRRAEVLLNTFTRKLAGKADGFVWEHYTKEFEIDWEYNKDDPKNLYRPWGFQPGHQIEWTKNLLNVYRYAPQDWMLERAKALFDGAIAHSWDDEHGGMVYGFGPDKKWCDDDKYFWVQGESIAASALLYSATKEEKYLEHYNNLWKYSWKHFIDHENGAWYGLKLTRDNKRYSEEKAFAGGKCDYHTLVSCIEALRAFPKI